MWGEDGFEVNDMSNLISGSQIYNYIKTQINPYGKPFEGTTFEFGTKIMEYIENMTPVEPVRGEWIEKESILCKYFSCSHCGGYNEYRTNFCGFCGADMRGEGNDGF